MVDENQVLSSGGASLRGATVKKVVDIVIKVLGGVGIIAIILALVFLFSGSKIVGKDSEVLAYKVVCTDKDIDRYNDKQLLNGGMPTTDVKEFNDEIMTRSEFAGDPNCVFMVTRYFVSAQNVSDSDKYLVILQDLYNKGSYPSGKFRDIVSVDTLRFYIDAMRFASPENGGDGAYITPGGGGGVSAPTVPSTENPQVNEQAPTN